MFRVQELVKASGGRLLSGNPEDIVRGVAIDSRAFTRGYAFIAVRGDNFDGHNFIARVIAKGAKVIIARKGFMNRPLFDRHKAVSFIEVKDTVKALGDIAAFNRLRFDIPVIAVCGSSGKTTAKEMIAHVLGARCSVLKNEGTKNNHIGVPLTLLRLSPRHKAVVLEIGTNHFGEVRNLASIARPDIGIITNIGPAHLGHFGTLAGVYIEKITLLDRLERPGLAILNADDFFLSRKLRSSGLKDFSLGFSLREKSEFSASRIRIRGSSLEFFLNNRHRYLLHNPAAHNIYNALCAIAVGRVFGMGHADISRRLLSFAFPKGRCGIVKRKGAQFIDDTYNSNPLSLAQGLSTLKNIKNSGRKILVMGDMLELGGFARPLHEKLGPYIANICDTLITVGRLSKLAGKAALRHGMDKSKVFMAGDAPCAREILFNMVKPQKDDIILVKGSRAMHMEEVLKI